jgi:hypothetical protein
VLFPRKFSVLTQKTAGESLNDTWFQWITPGERIAICELIWTASWEGQIIALLEPASVFGIPPAILSAQPDIDRRKHGASIFIGIC